MELVNDGGWHGARLPELRGDKYEKLKGAFGDVNPDGDSLVGQTIAIVSEDDLNIIEAIGWVFSGFFISMAEGAQLDGLGERFNIPRYGLTRSLAYVLYLLQPGQVISAGDAFTVSGSAGEWAINHEVKEDGKSATGFVLKVRQDAITSGNTFTINISGKPHSTQFQAGDTSDSILSRLYTQITAAETSLTTYQSSYGTLLYAADGRTIIPFSFADDVFEIVRAGIPATAYYQSNTEFPSVLFGYVANNDILVLANGVKGYLIEDDESYRERIQIAAAAARVNISASRPGVKNAVLAVSGVSYASVEVNRGINTNAEGIPGKSIQVFVAGGDDNEIAQAIYDASAAECGFHGDVSATATDGEITETVYFSRQSFQLVYVSVSGDIWDKETTGRPADYISVAKNTVTAYFSQLTPGKDVFAGQIYARLLTAFSTLTDVTVKIGIISPPTDNHVSVGSGIIAVTDSTSVTVV
ncbi:baseplate J/gp47 family protein [Citrobacter freundii]|uniref:baseplate J/gp47 family protein n=1 Tax=Citrobacter freundii TaxID=546 RepID=UPI0015E93CE3|nr:baseplate J/gp47 family protein [Citrobacter freundii]QLR92219.1 baseplate J/gp47 family protein [Citrobacter freundii]QLS40002.1 baseplate J/gp47 family protein [Citrobacter freundii]HBB4437303.1 baseplate J/gp47 family protein [Citrobacter freundii]HBN2658401.1 baseplate J/gp47 family protein [Citrobacter freundii]HBN2668865.1 baseplate J/gp47 family protein [Citrobacter freundii]